MGHSALYGLLSQGSDRNQGQTLIRDFQNFPVDPSEDIWLWTRYFDTNALHLAVSSYDKGHMFM